MQSDDRLIHFSTELIHAPAQHRIPVLQKLYYELSQTPGAGYDSSDFSVAGQPKFYSRRGQQTQSIALFLPDRIVLIEEWPEISLSAFLDKVSEVAVRAQQALGIAAYAAQTATLRSTLALTHYQDARVFLLDHACQQTDRIGPFFGRPIAVGGLRFFLPETPEHPGNLHVIIESFQRSLNEVYVEVKGVFGNMAGAHGPLNAAIEHIQVVRGFIRDHVFPYLNQYDIPIEEEAT